MCALVCGKKEENQTMAAILRLLLVLINIFIIQVDSSVFPQTVWTRGGKVTANPKSGREMLTFAYKCEQEVEKIIQSKYALISKYTSEIENKKCVPELGLKCDMILNEAVLSYSNKFKQTSLNLNEQDQEALAENLSSLKRRLEASLQLMQMKQLVLVRDKALQQYRRALKSSECGDFEAMSKADQYFRTEAESTIGSRSASRLLNSSVKSFRMSLFELGKAKKRLSDIKIKAAKNQEELISVLRHQNTQIEQLSEVAQGTYSPVNVGFSLRVPKTQINLSGSHQNGKGSVMVSCVPDESAHLVGQSGFSSVHSGDLGITIGGAI